MPYKNKEDRVRCRAKWLLAHPNYERDRARKRRANGTLKSWEWKNKPINYHEEYRRTHKKIALERAERHRASKMYGLSWEDYQTLDLRKRIENCEICGKPPSGTGANGILHIDHDHKTGKFRGLLCHHCNRGLGSFKDSQDALISAARYLKERC